MPNAGRLGAEKISEIMRAYKGLRKEGNSHYESCRVVGEIYGVTDQAIHYWVKKLAPTTTIAKQVLQANAFRLAERVVRKANVQESLDVLSRPELGVLTPKQAQTDGGQRGFFLTVSADSCGAVKASAAMIEGVPHAPAGSPVSSEDDPLWQENPPRLRGQQSSGSQELTDGGHAHPGGVQGGPADSENQGLQGADEQPAPKGKNFFGARKVAQELREQLERRRQRHLERGY